MRLDPSEAENVRLRLVDPKSIRRINMLYGSGEPAIRGFGSPENFAMSVWAGANPALFKVFASLQCEPRVGVYPLEDIPSGCRVLEAACDLALKIVGAAPNAGFGVRIIVQSKRVPQFPAGLSGPGYVCFLTVVSTSPSEKPVITTSDIELLSEFDASGERLVEFRKE